MSFLNDTGLAYFYNKLKEKFVQTVNGNLPENGNVEITNVATADNLTSADTLQFYDTYIGRISGGSANISNGDAYLSRIDGNVNIVGRVAENLEATGNNNLNITTNISLWKTQISVTGNYSFYYNKSTSSIATTTWTGDENWTFGGEIINLATYGLTIQNLITPNIILSTSASTGITGATVIPSTWINFVPEDGTYEFVYIEDSESGNYWSLNNNLINLNNYGIATTGTALDGDVITITYVSGTPNSVINVSYTAPVQGTIQVAKPTSFISTGYNQFNKNSTDFYLTNASIENGEIISSTGNYVCFCKAYAGSPRGYMAHSAEGYIIDGGWCATLPQIGSVLNQTQQEEDLKDTNFYSITFENTGYFVVAVSNISDLCIHIRWDSEEDEVDEEYVEPSIIELPMVGLDENNILVPLPLSAYGMPAVGDVVDTLNLDELIYIQKIGVYENTTQNMNEVIGMGVPYDFDTNYIYYVLESPISYKIPSTIDDKEVTSKYIVNDLGTEEFIGTIVPVGVWNIYGENLRNKLKVDVLTISEQNPALKDFQLKQIYKNLKLLDTIYPVGSIYMSVNNTNPGNFLGGTWERITGRFLLAATDNGDSGASQAAGHTGGEATHTLSISEMPAHTHTTPYNVEAWRGSSGNIRNMVTNGSGGNVTGGSTGGGAAHNNMPPYLSVYVWKRTV